jgi:hypothetical protein
VFANASYADFHDEENEWHFRLVNNGPGRAQVKLFVTCLDNRTGERDGHTHGLTFDYPASVAEPVTSGTVTSSVKTCAAGQIPVSPGFAFSAGGAGRVFRSYPSADELGWGWSFVGTGTGSVTTYLRCLDRTTTSAGSPAHTHKVDADLIPGYAGQHASLSAGEKVESTISSRAHDEGNIGGFWIDSPSQVYYLGQDARGQVRTARFWNTAAGGSIYLTIWGFDKRTTKYPAS